jgi:hypothetical protein
MGMGPRLMRIPDKTAHVAPFGETPSEVGKPQKDSQEQQSNVRHVSYFCKKAVMNIALTFSPNLFWDTDETALDPEKHTRFIIERVLTRGRLKDWFALVRL